MCCEKDLSYEEAKQLCQMAFDAGVDYHSTCTQFHCNAVAYDWEHWLKKNEGLFRPKPTVEDVLREFTRDWCNAACAGDMTNAERDAARADTIAEYAAKLQLKED